MIIIFIVIVLLVSVYYFNMIIVFGAVGLLVSLYYFTEVFKLILIHGFNHIPNDEFLSILDSNVPLWQQFLLSFCGVCMGLWILIYDQNLFNI